MFVGHDTVLLSHKLGLLLLFGLDILFHCEENKVISRQGHSMLVRRYIFTESNIGKATKLDVMETICLDVKLQHLRTINSSTIIYLPFSQEF